MLSSMIWHFQRAAYCPFNTHVTDKHRYPCWRKTRRSAVPILELLEHRWALASISFDGGPTGFATEWELDENWAGDDAPQFGDLALVDGYDVTVTGLNPPPHSVGAGAERLLLSNSTLTISDWGSLRFGSSPAFNDPMFGLPTASNVAVDATLEVVNGGLTVHFHPLEVDGQLSWYGGDLLGAVVNRGMVTLDGTSNLTLNGAAGLVNQATIVHEGTGNLRGIVTNEAGALYDIQSDVGTTSTFRNYGTLRKSGGIGVSSLSGSPTNNGGRIEVESGTLAIGSSAFTVVYNGGHLHADNGAVLDLNGGSTNTRLGATLTGSGDGTVLFASGAATTQSGGLTVGFPDGLFQWTGGVISGGADGLNNVGFITLSGANQKRTGGTWNNSGTIQQRDTGALRVIGDFHNLAGGVYEIQADAAFTDVGNNGVIHNNGTLRKSGGIGTARIDLPFTNTGLLDLRSGNLQSDATITNDAGEISVAAGSVLGSSSFSQAAGAGLTIELNGAASGKLQVAGSVTLAGSLSVDQLVPMAGTITIIDKVASQPVSGRFDGLPEAGVLLAGTTLYRISYVGGTGNDVTLTNVTTVIRDGDFNDDGVYDCADIDALVAEIAAGTNSTAFDLTGDLLVDNLDRDAWLALAGAANLASGRAFLPGDSNLDGFVDGSDYGIWNSHRFTTTAAWCSGDFTSDGVVDGADFNVWNSNKFTSALRETGSAGVLDLEPGVVAIRRSGPESPVLSAAYLRWQRLRTADPLRYNGRSASRPCSNYEPSLVNQALSRSALP